MFSKSNGFQLSGGNFGEEPFSTLRTQTSTGFNRKGKSSKPQSFSLSATHREMASTMTDFKPKVLESRVSTQEQFY